MGLELTVNSNIKAAMLARDKDKLEALRGIKAAFQLEKTKKGATVDELPDESAIIVLKRLLKQRKESASIFTSQNRSDLAEVELFQASVIETFMPVQMSDEQLREELKGILAEAGATSIKEMGKVMGMATKKLSGKADNKLIADLVKEMLGG